MATQTLEHILIKASEYPKKKAVVVPDESSVTYEKFHQEILNLKTKLIEIGLGATDVVSIVLPNSLEFLVTFFAVTSMGATAAPLNSAYKKDDFVFYLKDTESKIVLLPKDIPIEHDVVSAASELGIPCCKIVVQNNELSIDCDKINKLSPKQPPQSPLSSTTALFLHTSGTTSLPKGVPLSHENVLMSVKNISNNYELSTDDTSLIVMPLFHVHGLIGATLSTLYSGGTVVVPPRFSATTFWKHVHEYNVTWYSAVPTIHQILLLRAETKNECAGAKLRFIRSCSSSLAPSTFKQLEEVFGAPVLEAYGMTEASHQMASNPLPKHGVSKIGSVGKGTNVEISIRSQDQDIQLPANQPGEVCIRGKNVFSGYHKREQANKESFTPTNWFRTGDQGYIDEEGYLTLTGRIKELINRGGEKISPIELDAVLLSHPAIADAVSFGAPDPKYGEQVNCAVVLKDGETATNADIISFCKLKLADFKVPVKVFITKELPRTATGKTQRRFVAAHFLSKDQ